MTVSACPVIHCNMMRAGIQTYEDEPWQEWIDKDIVEDGEVMDEKDQGHQPVSPTSGVIGEVPLPQVTSCGASMGIPRCSHEVAEEGDPLVNPEDEGRKQITMHNGDTYDKDCEHCRKAMGMKRPHKHGNSNHRKRSEC